MRYGKTRLDVSFYLIRLTDTLGGRNGQHLYIIEETEKRGSVAGEGMTR
jgi:hypothetical protein